MFSLATKSDQALQMFTFQCSGVPAWYDRDLSSTDNALTIMGSNEHVFNTKELMGVRVLQDDCKVSICLFEMLDEYPSCVVGTRGEFSG